MKRVAEKRNWRRKPTGDPPYFAAKMVREVGPPLTGTAINGLGSGDVTRDHIAALHGGAGALEHILNRHIWDEEEIIIPIFLRHA